MNDVKAAAAEPRQTHAQWEAATAAWRESEKIAAEEMKQIDELAARLMKGRNNGN